MVLLIIEMFVFIFRRHQWYSLIGVKIKKMGSNFSVCQIHFTEENLRSGQKDVLPSLHIPYMLEPENILHEDGDLEDCTVKVQIESEEEDDDYTAMNPAATSSTTSRYEHGPKMLIPCPQNFYTYFELFVTNNLLGNIADETNKSAQVAEANNDTEEWIDTNPQELKVFLGLLLHMGSYKLERIEDYWKKDQLLNTQFANYMPLTRFKHLVNYIKFSSVENSSDTLWEVRPIIDHFNGLMKEMYKPDSVLMIEDSVWQERDAFPSFFFMKEVGKEKEMPKLQNQLYLLRQPNGLILKLLMHRPTADTVKSTDEMIMELVEDRHDLGHSLYLRSHQASIELARQLLARGTFCTGSLSSTTPNIPEKVANALHNSEVVIDEEVLVGKWHFKEDKHLLYVTTEIMRHKKLKRRKSGLPAKLHQLRYTELKYLDIHYLLQNNTLPYHFQLFVYFLMASVVNAHILCSDFFTVIGFQSFRSLILEELLPPFLPEVERSSDYRLTIPHRLHRTCKKLKLCDNCSITEQKQTLTNLMCSECPNKPALCVDCYNDIHV